ncbi:hypothetical protein C2S51_007414 [Perilla frutescens var. frutescens]|nr:hypothetical protein C2S51_007414 [Perilla frutescens var. frutescens]
MDSTKLPIIEFNHKKLNPGSNSWKTTSDSVRRALESYGCLVIEYEEMSSELDEAMFGLSEELFGFPIQTKMKHTSQLAGFGYGGNFSAMPLVEYFGIEYDATDLEPKKKFAGLFWPDGNHRFCEILQSYCNLLSEMERTVTKMVASSYGLEKYYEPLITSSFYMSRLMRYHSPGENNSSIGLIPHRDKNFVSIIGTNDVRGLEIQTRDGDWITFHPSPRKFILIVGEAFMAWSNGRLYCPLHKVVATREREKYSIGLFSFVNGVVKVLEELVDDDNPLKFKPFNHLDFLDYCKEGGEKMTEAIQTYCGI